MLRPLLGIGLLMGVWSAATLLPTDSRANASEPSQDYQRGVCHGLRASGDVDPAQAIMVIMPGGVNFRCAPTEPGQGKSWAVREVQG